MLFTIRIFDDPGISCLQEVSHAEVDDQLQCEREVGNHSDTFAVAVKKETVTVGHVPQAIYNF